MKVIGFSQCSVLFFCLWNTFQQHFVDCAVNIHPRCYPVSVPECAETSAVISLDLSAEEPPKNYRNVGGKSGSKGYVDDDGVLLWRYNSTTYPTFGGDKSEADSVLSFSKLHPLISSKCSKFIKVFLCSVHSPVCTNNGLVPPCRELCEVVKSDCRKVTDVFNIAWPERLNCENFPSRKEKQRKEPSEYVKQGDNTFVISRHPSLIWAEALLDEGNVCIPPSDEDVIPPALARLQESETPSSELHQDGNFDFGVICPPEMRAPFGHVGYTFMGLPNCTAPCPNMYLRDDELQIVHLFVFVLALVCLLVTSFTLLTFAITTNRFRYPERPILFYAFCYLIVSIVFLFGFAVGEKVSCNEKIINENNEIIQGFAVVEGFHKRLCSVMLLILYYFTVSGTLWWLILTVTWLLAAGFSWGSEAIEQRHLFYHALAWGLPALQTLIVFISNKVEGDNIAGVCFVGLYDVDALLYLLLLPMCFYLMVGIGNLFTGFFFLNRVRKKLGEDQKNKEKLAKFMLRIGVFSVLYMIPQVALVVIYVIEVKQRAYWEATWYAETCAEYGVPCPASSHPVAMKAVGLQHPGMYIFFIKYAMTLVVGLPPLFWVASKKTMNSWRNFFTRKKPCANTNLNSTQNRLLNDSNGPHARDQQVKLEGRLENTDAVFGNMCNAELRGSSASVAAQLVSKHHPISALQRQWEDLTDSDSTYYGTSVMDSELSQILAFESQRNRDVRVVGRKDQLVKPNDKKPSIRNNRSQEGIVKKSHYHCHKSPAPRSSCGDRNNSAKETSYPTRKTALRPENIAADMHVDIKQKTRAINKKQERKFISSQNVSVSKDESIFSEDFTVVSEPVVGLPFTSQKKPTNDISDELNDRNNQSNKPVSVCTRQSDVSRASSRKKKSNKPLALPPPVPPPRLDSIVVVKNLSPKRVLSV